MVRKRLSSITDLIFLALVFLGGSSAFALTPESTTAWLEGNWTCTGWSFNSSNQKFDATINLTGTKILNESWLDITYAEAQTPQNPHPYTIKVLASLQPDAAGNVTLIGFVNTAVPFRYSLAAQTWANDQLIWQGSVVGRSPAPTGYKMTWSNYNGNSFHWATSSVHGGRWIDTSDITCNRN